MKWAWRHHGADEPAVVRQITDEGRQVRAEADRLRGVTYRLEAAADALVRRNSGQLSKVVGDRRRSLNPAYAGPERRRRW